MMYKVTKTNKQQAINTVNTYWTNAVKVWNDSGSWNFDIDYKEELINLITLNDNFYFELY